MVYTCFQMFQDCRGDQPEGWRYFASAYVPVVRRLLAHYNPGADVEILTESLLGQLRRPGSSLFASLDPSPERPFIAELRQRVLSAIPLSEPEHPLDLATVSNALAPLTMTEKVAAWFEGMRYDAPATAELMRISAATVEKIRGRSADLIRGAVDTWNRTLLTENGLSLGREAAAAHTADCLPVKAFLDILDGRTTWSDRESMELHVTSCFHCIDHYARMQEVIGLLRACPPLSDADAARYRKVLGVAESRRPVWKRLLGAR